MEEVVKEDPGDPEPYVIFGQLALQERQVTDAEQLYARLLHLMSLSAEERQAIEEKLRAIVVRDHTLKNLCQQVLAELESARRPALHPPASCRCA